MSKPNIRKITADPTKCNTDSLRRPSVFERLGTKPAIAAAAAATAAAAAAAAQSASDYCRNWALNGSCSYGKSCKYANTHTLISPSKRAKKDNAIAGTSGLIEDPFKRLTSKIVKKASHSPDLNIEEWNQTDLEYEDEKVLERRRQLLQRELELQMKKDKEVHGKDKVRQKKKAMSSSSSSRTSSTSSSSSSSSSEDSSSTSTSDSHKKVKKIKTKRHHSISADYSEDKERKRKLKLKRLGTRNDKAVSKKKRKLENSSAKKDLTINRSVKKYGPSSVSRKHSTSLRARSPAIQQGSTSGVTSTTAATLGSQVSVAHHISSSSKIRERNRSESPKAMKGNREMDKEDGRHYKKMRDMDECLSKDATKCKSFDKIKEQQDKEKNRAIDEKTKADDRLRAKCKDKDVRSRTPPAPPSSERSSKYQHVKESISSKTRRSRTPDKTPSRTRRDLTPVKNPEKQGGSSNRARDIEKKDRDSHKRDKSKERDDGRKNEPTSSGKAKQTVTSSQDESYRRNNVNKDNFDEKTYGDKARQKSREHQREKETRDERHSRLVRDQRQEPQREKDKDESQERCRNERQRERDRDRDRDRERERERDRERDRERERERERDREREREREIRERDRERDREREKSIKSRERDVPAVIPSATLSLSTDKSSRYGNRIKERPLGKDVSFEKTAGTRERSRSERERERSETKALAERERSSTQSRLDGRYERSGVIEKDVSSSRSKSTSVNSPRDRMDRFREASLDRASLHDKSGHAATSSSIQSTATLPVPPVSSSSTVAPPSSRDHLMDIVDGHYDRDRHRRFGVRYERGHASEHTSRKDQARIESSRVPSKIDRIVDRRDANSPRHAIEVDRNFGRNYGRMPEHWDEQEEATPHVEYREHAHIHEDDRRKAIEGRRYDSPFEERRVARDERSRESRYVIQTTERASFDDHRHHHHHHRHPLYPGDKLRNSGANIRDETVSNDNWEGHHRDVEHGPRDRGYQPVEWEEREWRTRTVWEGRDSLPRSEVHDDEWNSRYDNSMGDWKTNDARKWDNQNVHVRSHYRNERSKDLEHGEPAQHSKRRSYNAPESREEPAIHPSAKQAAIYGSMKEEPINKKLMELAEGRLCTTTREKSSDNFQKKNSQKDKPEVKESVPVEPKRPVADESLQTLHTESDLSDISDDPDDILNMEEDTTDIETNKTRTNKKAPDTTNRDAQSTTQESAQLSPKEPAEETIFSSKSKDNADTVSLKNMEDDNMETMDFEEISDGELEEDIKTSGKGLGDALGVDWESLVKETQAKRNDSSNQDSTESRWQCRAIFYRIGISKKYAGDDFVKKLLKKYEKNDQKEFLLSDIALMHTALARNRLLQDLDNNAMHTIDDSLYRNHNASYDEDVDYDWETLKPSTALYEEAKCLLQQVTRKDNEICT